MFKRVLRWFFWVACWRWAAFRAWFGGKLVPGGPPKLVIVPCDPWTVSGSRGDEAMLTALVQDFRARHPQSEIVLTPAPGVDPGRVKTGALADARIEPVWRGRVPFLNIFRLLRREAPAECCVLGADCMDGHYSVLTSLTLLASADLSARLGIPTRLTGFSFNATPAKGLTSCFRLTTPELRFLLRDPVSLQRFTGKTGCRAELVADVAFLMRPQTTERTRPYERWAQRERARGQRLLGFNVHGLLFAGDPDAKAAALAVIGRQLRAFMDAQPDVSCLLVPHDFRCGGDLECLLPVAEALEVSGGRVSVIREALSAAELKSVCGALDGVFASRMHLGIAALGMGKPVAGFGYQGKFAGLFRHFGLSEEWVLDVADTAVLAERLDRFAGEWPGLTRRVAERLPAVMAAAGKNLV
jgi:polysaccharide pyruvyl transferase WcaK-like protein